jgi:hypothetical protein
MHRSTIEQAKGIRGVAYGMTLTRISKFSKWSSQEFNIKLRVLAGRLIAQFQSRRYDEAPPRR